VQVSVGLNTDLVHVPGFISGRGIAETALCAEACGFDAVWLTDHPVPHPGYELHAGHQTIDPFVALATAAAATTTLRLQTHMLIAPYRPALVLAKAIASLDVVSGGRVLVGIASGYMEPEVAALGVDFAERNELTDEAIRVMKAAWTGKPVEHRGRHISVEGNVALPVPVQEPHPRLWIGGNSKIAIRRAVELGDGWAPQGNRPHDAHMRHAPSLMSLDDLAERLDYMREYAASVGRTTPLDVVFSPAAFDVMKGTRSTDDEVVEAAHRLAELGVTYFRMGLPGDTPSAYLAELERFAGAVLPELQRL